MLRWANLENKLVRWINLEKINYYAGITEKSKLLDWANLEKNILLGWANLEKNILLVWANLENNK